MKIVRDEGESKGKGKKAKVVDTLVKFDIETAVIVALDTKYKDIKVTDGKSKAFVMGGLAEYRELRLSVVDGHKKQKAEALEFCRFLDNEKIRVLGRLEPGETKLKESRKEYDDEIAAKKAEKEAIEQARVDKIRSRINDLQAMNTNIPLLSLEELREINWALEATEISVTEYMEFTEEANKVLSDVHNFVEKYITTAIQKEKEDVERKEEEARLEKIRIEQDAAQKKIDEANQKLKEKEAALEKKEWERIEKLLIAKEMEEEKIRVEKEQEVETERLEKEIVEQNRLKPDKEKLVTYASDLIIVSVPSMKTNEARELLIKMCGRLDKLITGFKNQIGKL